RCSCLHEQLVAHEDMRNGGKTAIVRVFANDNLYLHWLIISEYELSSNGIGRGIFLHRHHFMLAAFAQT
ncbi:MAG: hypothetical protein RMJ44_12450, partial [Cytophagales bacterium]|nr:hypothetical protein [Cytophagales bacterium]